MTGERSITLRVSEINCIIQALRRAAKRDAFNRRTGWERAYTGKLRLCERLAALAERPVQ